MWWGQSSENQRGERNVSPRAIWFILFIAIGVAVMSSRGWGWGWWWMFFLIPLFIGPKIWRHVSCDSGQPGKRKNDAAADEKPKRSFIRDDGEMLEVIEEDAPRRKNPDDIEYV